MNKQNETVGTDNTLVDSSASKLKQRGKGIILPISITIFVITLGFVGYLKYSIWSIDNDITAIRQEIAEYDSRISSLKNDTSVVAMELINANKSEINTDIARSDIQKYVTALQKLWSEYKVVFNGFSFSDETITTTLSSIASSGSTVDPIENIIRFISDFRSGDWAAKESPFLLSLITVVSGDKDSRTFNVEFTLK